MVRIFGSHILHKFLCDSKQEFSIKNILIENFYNELITSQEQELLKLLFSNKPSQKAVDNLLEFWDIETKGADKSLLLAYFMKEHPEIKFRRYEIPRLYGLLMKLRFKNLQTIALSLKIIKQLNKKGIIPIVLKGAAMKFFRPDLARIMGDVDILVPENDFLNSIETGKSLGFFYKKIFSHSVDFYDSKTGKNIIDIHRYIHMGTGFEREINEDLFRRAKIFQFNDASVLLPSNEDMLFITLVNLYKNLKDKTSKRGILYSLFDCKFLIENKKDFDWQIVLNNAAKTKTEMQVDFAVSFLDKISNGIFPSDIRLWPEFSKFQKAAQNNLYMILYNRFFIDDLRQKCKPLKIKNIFKSSEICRQYLLYKPKYFCLKLLKSHPLIIKFIIHNFGLKSAGIN